MNRRNLHRFNKKLFMLNEELNRTIRKPYESNK